MNQIMDRASEFTKEFISANFKEINLMIWRAQEHSATPDRETIWDLVIDALNSRSKSGVSEVRNAGYLVRVFPTHLKQTQIAVYAEVSRLEETADPDPVKQHPADKAVGAMLQAQAQSKQGGPIGHGD